MEGLSEGRRYLDHVLAKLFREIFDQVGSGICWQFGVTSSFSELEKRLCRKIAVPLCGQIACLMSENEVPGCRDPN